MFELCALTHLQCTYRKSPKLPHLAIPPHTVECRKRIPNTHHFKCSELQDSGHNLHLPFQLTDYLVTIRTISISMAENWPDPVTHGAKKAQWLARLTTLPLQLAVVLFTSYVIWRIIAAIKSYRRLSHIPGPTFAALSNLWLLRSALRGEMWREWGVLCEALGACPNPPS